VAFWRREDWSVAVQEGADDIALALATDAWTRTGRVHVVAVAPGPVKLKSGLVLVAQPAAGKPGVELGADATPVRQLDRTLCEIDRRFGAASREVVATELEYPAGASCAP
jgi:hypothetical protein